MARRARLYFQPIDYSYHARYGIMPDYDFTNRLKAGQPLEEVAALINGRLREIYEEEKRAYEESREGKWEPVSADASCPF